MEPSLDLRPPPEEQLLLRSAPRPQTVRERRQLASILHAAGTRTIPAQPASKTRHNCLNVDILTHMRNKWLRTNTPTWAGAQWGTQCLQSNAKLTSCPTQTMACQTQRPAPLGDKAGPRTIHHWRACEPRHLNPCQSNTAAASPTRPQPTGEVNAHTNPTTKQHLLLLPPRFIAGGGGVENNTAHLPVSFSSPCAN